MAQVSKLVRYLVLSTDNDPIYPADHAEIADSLALQLRKPESCSHLTSESAKSFALALAEANPGERFYVAQVIGGAVTGGTTYVDCTDRGEVPDSDGV